MRNILYFCSTKHEQKNNIMAKVSKEQARQIYNRYSQIEDAEELMEKLKDFTHEVLVNDKPKLMDNQYHPYGTIELHVPTFSEGKFNGSYRIVGISYPSAMRVLKNHVKQLKRELAELQNNLDQCQN